MGNAVPQVTYSVECSEKRDGETSIRRSPVSATGLKKVPERDINNMQEAWLKVVKTCGNL